jgi:hypothetical protein
MRAKGARLAMNSPKATARSWARCRQAATPWRRLSAHRRQRCCGWSRRWRAASRRRRSARRQAATAQRQLPAPWPAARRRTPAARMGESGWGDGTRGAHARWSGPKTPPSILSNPHHHTAEGIQGCTATTKRCWPGTHASAAAQLDSPPGQRRWARSSRESPAPAAARGWQTASVPPSPERGHTCSIGVGPGTSRQG